MATTPVQPSALQRAYLVGRDTDTELGGVSTHGYFEFVGPPCDPTRLQGALDAAIAAHAALRTGVTGRDLTISDAPAAFPLVVHDLCGHADAENIIEKLRVDQCSVVRQGWPLFGVTLVQETADRSRLLVDVDGLAVDLGSIRALIEEIQTRYIGHPIPKVPAGPATAPATDSGARAWWHKRLPDLPPPPRLVLHQAPAEVTATRFVGRHHLLPAPVWSAARDAARCHGITPTGLALAVFAETLHRCGAGDRFTVAAPTRSTSRNGSSIGQLAGIVPLAVEWSGSDPTTRAKMAQRTLMEAALHASGAGPELLADLAREHGLGPTAPLPVVFTSGIGLPGRMAPPGWELATLTSQTAGIWLDAQVTEVPDGLMIHWDTVDECLEDADALFAAHLTLWHAHADPAIWQSTEQREPVRGASWIPLVRPRGPLEELLAVAWSYALDVRSLGRDDDLLALGAGPASAATCAAWLTDWFGQPVIDAAELASATTVTALARNLSGAHPNLPQVAELSLAVAAELDAAPSAVPPIPDFGTDMRFQYCPTSPLETL